MPDKFAQLRRMLIFRVPEGAGVSVVSCLEFSSGVPYDSNYPPSIIRSVPEAINKRLSNISSDKSAFDSAIPPYQSFTKKRLQL